MPAHPWDTNYSPFRITNPEVTGDIAGVLSADWDLLGGTQTPRDIMTPAAGSGVDPGSCYEPGSATVAPSFRYSPSEGVRNVFFRASAVLKAGALLPDTTPAGAAYLIVYAGTVGWASIRLLIPNYGGTAASGKLSATAGGITTIYQMPSISGQKWYRVGFERTMSGVTFYWNPIGEDYWGWCAPDSEMIPFSHTDSNVLSERQKDPISSDIYLGAALSGPYGWWGGFPKWSGIANPYLAETQLLFDGSGARPPRLPTEPINLPSGSISFGPAPSYPPWSPPSLSFDKLAETQAYHRYKNIRSAMNIYTNLRLDQ